MLEAEISGGSSHAPTAPSRLADSRLNNLFEDATHGVIQQGRFAPTTRLVEQTVQSLRLKALTPTGDLGSEKPVKRAISIHEQPWAATGEARESIAQMTAFSC